MHGTLIKLLKIAEEQKRTIFIVGGFVRDHLAGLEIRDVDLVVSEDAIQFAKRVAWRLRADYKLLDSAAQYSRVSLKTYCNKMLDLDFSLLRNNSIIADLKSRDFTINAMAVNLKDYLAGEGWESGIIDPCGGRDDLRAGLLRITGKRSLADDPIRLMRSARLLLRFGLTLDENSRQAVRKFARAIKSTSRIRVAIELFLLLAAVNAAEGMRILHAELSVLGEIFAPFAGMSEKKDKRGESLLEHGLRTCEQLEKILRGDTGFCPQILGKLHMHLSMELEEGRTRLCYLKLACIIHDIGKLDAPVPAGGRHDSFSHGLAGDTYVDGLSQRLNLSEKEHYHLTQLVRNHSRPFFLRDDQPASYFRFFQQFKNLAPELLLLKAASIAGRGGCNKKCAEILGEYFSGTYKDLPETVISAGEIMDYFNLPPTRFVGSLLEEAYSAQLSGRVRTKEEALSLISALVSNKTGYN
ncbi:MAG: hypothetical protein KGZ79_05825 [Dethiobacter sp.]|jgi:poly(A) polymerase|nr:hypothetical protein [Dethiobacter sp.]